jgi:hypothetical protein
MTTPVWQNAARTTGRGLWRGTVFLGRNLGIALRHLIVWLCTTRAGRPTLALLIVIAYFWYRSDSLEGGVLSMLVVVFAIGIMLAIGWVIVGKRFKPPAKK